MQGSIEFMMFSKFLPGPEATELCIFLARKGRIGGFLDGVCHAQILLILLFSFIYAKVELHNAYFNASFCALQPIVAAMVLRAVYEIGDHSFIFHRDKN